MKIRHSDFFRHQNKYERLAKICKQLHIVALPPKVELSVAVLAAMKYGLHIHLKAKALQKNDQSIAD